MYTVFFISSPFRAPAFTALTHLIFSSI
jgi:hypothetical protein